MALAAINWTLLLATAVTGFTAVVVAFIGYLGGRLSSTAAARQTEAETERLRVTHNEQHRQQRQAVYHDLLNVERQWALFVGEQIDGGGESPSPAEDPSRALYAHLNGAILFGTQEVAEAAVEYIGSLAGLRNSLSVQTRSRIQQLEEFRVRSPEELPDFVREVAKPFRRGSYESRRKLINAMRADVAPDSAPVRVWNVDESEQPE